MWYDHVMATSALLFGKHDILYEYSIILLLALIDFLLFVASSLGPLFLLINRVCICNGSIGDAAYGVLPPFYS
jgi:hypothetical protein